MWTIETLFELIKMNQNMRFLPVQIRRVDGAIESRVDFSGCFPARVHFVPKFRKHQLNDGERLQHAESRVACL